MFKLDIKEIAKRILSYVLVMVLVLSILPIGCLQVEANDFETKISAFPESYKPYLRVLHQKYPQWIFKAYDTGLDFSEAVANEASNNKSLLEKSYNSYLKSKAPGDYIAATGVYIGKDGSSWVSASRNAVAYFMDPRNFLNETHITMFEQLSYDSVNHTQAGVEAILTGSFMSNINIGYLDASGKYIPTNEKYSAKLMEAGNQTKVSPYYLASKILQEVGKGTGKKDATSAMGSGSSVNGQYSGLEGLYNFYNIGASDDANGGAVKNGLEWAKKSTTYLRPWNTPAKAIVGGAMFIGEKYINVGQDTTYFQRFNVVKESPYKTYDHQYMTSIYGCASESSSVMKAYNSLGITASAKTFLIPVYQNMPEKTTTLAIGSGTKIGVVNSNVNIRNVPNTTNSESVIETLQQNETVTLLEGVMTDIPYSTRWLSNPYWYKVRVTRSGKTYEGYLSANYVNVASEINVLTGVPQQISTSISKAETIYYEVDDPSVATVDATGVVTGLKDGTTTVRAYTQTGKFSVCGITVISKGAIIDKSKVDIGYGETLKLGVTVYPLNSADKTVTWQSSNPQIVTVSSDGTIKGVNYGQADITATAKIGGVVGKCRVVVVKPVEGVKLNKSSIKIAVGSEYQLEATVSPSDATYKSVKWKSSDKKVASVSSKGVVTAVASGNATITATTTEGNKVASCTVKVKPEKITTFKASTKSYNSLKLSWEKLSNVDGYRIYRKNSKGKYKLLKVVSSDKTSYTDKSLSTGKTYSYKIAGYAKVGSKTRIGVKSNSDDARVIPGKTSIKSLKLSGTTSVKISWKKIKGASGYVVYRYNPTTGKYKKIKTIKKASTLSYKNKKLKVGTKYKYKVRAYKTVNGERVYGKYSKAKSITR